MIKQAVEPYKKEVSELRTELINTKESLVKLECYSRRYNLKFYGVSELPYESTYDCKRMILQILHESNINIPPKAIEHAHRLGPKQPRNPRPIMIKLFHEEEKQLILAKSQHIWHCTHISIEEDFATKVEENRRTLKPILHAANKKIDRSGKKEFYAKLRMDKLSINGKVYTVDNMDRLPAKLNPEQLSTPTNGNTTAFFTRNSPLSNHHLATQKIDHRTYNCNEQFYMSQKARMFKDHAAEAAIMKELDPGKQKTLGRNTNIKNFNQTTWNNSCLDIMKRGLEAKFTQNEKIRNFLLQTGTTMLVEGNPKDSYWGAGMSLSNPNIWEKNRWLGTATNHLGRLLDGVRREIRSSSLE